MRPSHNVFILLLLLVSNQILALRNLKLNQLKIASPVIRSSTRLCHGNHKHEPVLEKEKDPFPSYLNESQNTAVKFYRSILDPKKIFSPPSLFVMVRRPQFYTLQNFQTH